MSRPLRFIQLSDTHLGPGTDFLLYGVNPYRKLEQVIESLKTLNFEYDFIVHCGDVVDAPDAVGYELSQKLFSQLNVPVYYLSGNHDDSALLAQKLIFGDRVLLGSNPERVFYAVESQDFLMLFLDFTSKEKGSHGEANAEELKLIDSYLSKTSKSVVIFTHFAPFELDCPWIDELMVLANGNVFHDVLAKFQRKIRGVFYGHVHRGIQLVKDGILYSSAPSVYCQLSTFPTDSIISASFDEAPGYNLVTVYSDRIIVKSQAV